MITALSLILIFLAIVTIVSTEIGWTNITLPNRNNIVFEQRNQKYGAYSIRKAYNDHMLKALGLMFLVVMAFFSGNLIWKNLFKDTLVATSAKIHADPTKMIEVNLEQEFMMPAEEVPEKIAAAVSTTEQLTSMIDVVKDAAPAIKSQDDFVNASPGTVSAKGDGPATPGEVAGNASPGVSANVVYDIPEVNPSYPGGYDALMKYLGRNIRYPEMEKENGIQGTVYVTFVVGPTGEISGITELKGVKGGSNLGKEAIRVLRTMPNWTPGKVGGQPVSVRFNLPVKFILN